MHAILLAALVLAALPLKVLAASDFFALAPCRILDTSGGPKIGTSPTTVTIRGTCGVPLWATSVTGNLTVVSPTQLGFVRVTPAGRTSNTSTHNYRPGKTRANNFTSALSATGQIDLLATSSVDVRLDVSGYFGTENAWHVDFSYPLSWTGSIDYFGFPFAMQAVIPGGSLEVRSGNPVATNPNVCPFPYSNNIETRRTVGGFPITYLTSAGVGVNRLLYYSGAQLFTDPTTGTRYNGALYFDSQEVETCPQQPCDVDAKWASYTNDGVTFTPRRKLFDYCDLYGECTSSWYCDNGFPCDTASPRQWYTAGTIIPSVYVNGAFYAIALIFRVNAPGLPQLSQPEVWTMSSADGNTWVPYLQANGAALDPPFFQAACLPGPWILNPDLARDPVTDTYYLVRSYSDNYAGCPLPGPGGTTLPNRFQVYSAQGATAFVNGTWTKLLDLGCGELGFQPDSASILHDGLGNVVHSGGSGITLYVGVSGANAPNACGGITPGSCGTPPSHRVQVVVVSP